MMVGFGVKSVIFSIGILLEEGIGDTIRVSLTGDPSNEIQAARNILSSLNLRKIGPRIISCPTCGRLQIDLENLLKKVEKETKNIVSPITIAVMGCSVNGPGEAKEADIGVVGGKGNTLLYKNGMMVGNIEGDVIEILMKEIENA